MKVLDRALPALVVDDSRVMCEIMCRILKQVGFQECEYVMGAIDALMQLKSKRYGILLTDLDMNPVPGDELIRLIWADKEIPPTPIVLTSAHHDNLAKVFVGAERQVADVYILKPFTAESLDRKLAETFGDDR